MPLTSSLRHTDFKGLLALSSSMSALNKLEQQVNKQENSRQSQQTEVKTIEAMRVGGGGGDENEVSTSDRSGETATSAALSPKFLFSPSTSSKQSSSNNNPDILMHTFGRCGASGPSANERRLSVVSTCLDDDEDEDGVLQLQEDHHQTQQQPPEGPKVAESPTGSVKSDELSPEEVSLYVRVCKNVLVLLSSAVTHLTLSRFTLSLCLKFTKLFLLPPCERVRTAYSKFIILSILNRNTNHTLVCLFCH